MVFSKSYAEIVARARVPAGTILVFLFVWLSLPDRKSLVIGMPVALLGMLLRGWAAGHLEKNIRLTTSGPFARVRNPLYLGSLLVGTGFGFAANDTLVSVLIGLFFLGFYLPVVEEEERHLDELFGGYQEYRQRVPKLVPLVRAAYRGGQGFRWARYAHNREHQALIAFLVILSVLTWRAF